ncbi:MAG TPA: response regulator [Polyangiaceae bacterium]|jgi:CheY-like chemotaxis protein
MATKVLVFESDPAFAGELRSEFGKLGCSTTVVDDGNFGLQQAATEKPDLILLAIELPRMNGFSVCNKLKKDPGLKDVPLIIMSTESSDETFEQHKKLRTRAEDYVHKPIAFGELLKHILEFIPLVSSFHESDGAIVIDDEIEIGTTDYLGDDEHRPEPAREVQAPAGVIRRIETVDADVDAFAESAFGKMTGSDAPPASDTHVGPNGASRSSIPAAAAPYATATQVSPRVSSRPPISGGGGEGESEYRAKYEAARDDLGRLKARFDEVDGEFEELRGEVARLRDEAAESERRAREIEELKARLASGTKSTAASSREFLDLREALNRKDKEILTLKEQISKKERQIVETQDRSLASERAHADLEERLLTMEREVADTRDKNESLVADRELAKKASDDFRTRLEKAKADGEAKDRQIAESRGRHAEELAAAEDRFAAQRADLDQTLANERAEHARALDQSEDRRKKDVDTLKRDYDAQLAGARNEWQAELTRTRQEAEQREQARLDDLRSSIEGKAARDLAAAEGKAAGDLAALESKAANDLASLSAKAAGELASAQTKAAGELAALEARTTSEIGEARARIATLEEGLSATRGEVDALRDAKEDLEAKLGAAGARAGSLESDLGSTRYELLEVKQRLSGESSRADGLQAKWSSDRQSLERAKDALAVALSQIEEAEGREPPQPGVPSA